VILGLGEGLLLLVVAGLLALLGWTVWTTLRRATSEGAPALPARQRAEVAAAIAAARWVPGHDEVDGATRILVRRTYTGLDGHPAVLEERVLHTFPADDPAWEARFTEGMAAARFRCSYLNTEEERE
jgi:hypothetical protein